MTSLKEKNDILIHFEIQLLNLMSSPFEQCRNMTFTLILRLLRQNPRKAINFVATYLECLALRTLTFSCQPWKTWQNSQLYARKKPPPCYRKCLLLALWCPLIQTCIFVKPYNSWKFMLPLTVHKTVA